MSWFIGAHINREKTLLQTLQNIKNNGGNSLQIFVSNPRSALLTNINNYINIADDIKNFCKENNFKIVIHSPYTVNMAKEFKNGKKDLPIGDCYWVQLLLHELKIANILNAHGVVVHVGKHTKLPYNEGIKNMKNVLQYVIEELIAVESVSKIILETPAGQGTELLKNLEEFIAFYNTFTEQEKKYLGICLDTAHVWSAGYELEEAFKILFAKNSKDVCVIHYNNSKREKSSMVDKHQPILQGEIPLVNMKNFIELLKPLKKKPIIILETPDNILTEFEWLRQVITK